LPVDTARATQLAGLDGPDIEGIGTAVAKFKSGHPYLLFDRPAIASIRNRALRNPQLLRRLEQSLREPVPAAHDADLRAGIKRRSRRLVHIAFLALISDGRMREDALRATRGALSLFARTTSWNARPVIKSFLDCAEIAVAVSLAYDWLYDELAAGEREIVEEALLLRVVEPALAAYTDPFAIWPRRRDNCTLVSNSGVLIAALAVLDRHRDASLQLIRRSIASSWRVFDVLAPDGGWPEGLSYWSLAMRYAGLMVAALESTFGQSFGLANRPGLAQTGDFALHAVGTSGSAFNFGDSEPQFDLSPLAWFAHRFKRPTDARLVHQYDGWYLPFAAIWAGRSKVNWGSARPPPTGRIFYSCNLACFRSTWSTEPAARPVYLAIKGGNTFGSSVGPSSRREDVILHAQADAGSFIVDGARRRWIIDLGSDDYDLPGYFDHGDDSRCGPRWQYYRTQTAGHNTLVIDGRNQLPNARVPIIGSRIDSGWTCAIFDMSAAYGNPVGSIRRGAALVGRQVLIQDEISPEVFGTITWVAHTSADPVSVAGPVARFRTGGDRFVARILEPETACFDLSFPPEPRSFPVSDIRQLHGRRAVSGNQIRVSELPRRADDQGRRAAGPLIRRLQIVWPKGVQRLSVLLLPDCDDEQFGLPVVPLSNWLAKSPVRLAGCRRWPHWTKAEWRGAGGPTIGAAPPKPRLVSEYPPGRTGHA
jgi:Heparinase II/III-like protein